MSKRGLVGLACAALLLGAVAPLPVQAGDEICGTAAALKSPSRPNPGMPGGLGPWTAGTSYMSPPIEVPAGGGRAGDGTLVSPVAPAPPGPTPPVAGPLPGLPPLKASNDDESGKPRVEAIQARGEVPEERLLDVGVQTFEDGITEADREKLAQSGLSPELRRAEARFAAFHLKTTLEGTGNWGAVRVLPGPAEGIDLLVSGRILESNGKRLELEVDAVDATGRRWLQRRYRGEADRSAYLGDRLGRYEAFQEVYNRIANDLLAARDERDAEDLVAVRRVSALRFAAVLSPEAFAPHLKASGQGRFSLVRLPAEDDPMARRVAQIRERDQMLVDTLNDRYLTFYERMSGPYASWRMYSLEEQDTLDRIRRESRLKKILGGAAVLGGLIMDGDSQGERIIRDVAVFGGMSAIQSGFRQAGEARIHEAALQELATSFDGEVEPLLVDLEGQQLKLTGPAEVQFAAWRDLLSEMFVLETGAPDDPNAVTVTAAPPSR